MIYFLCTAQALLPADYTHIHWLEQEKDYPLAKEYWKALGQELKRSTWEKAHEYGYSYTGVIEDGRVVSIAGVWRFSETYWEVAAVSTLLEWRNKGYAQRTVAFVTAYIFASSRQPTCSTDDDNPAMIRTAERVGFQRISPEQVKWKYPRLPDF